MPINKEYKDWDSIILQLNEGETAKSTIRMMRQDMEVMAENHKVGRAEVIEMMIQALEEDATKEEKQTEDAES